MCFPYYFQQHNQTLENIFQTTFQNTTKYLKIFSFPENSISEKYLFFEKYFTRTKHSLRNPIKIKIVSKVQTTKPNKMCPFCVSPRPSEQIDSEIFVYFIYLFSILTLCLITCLTVTLVGNWAHGPISIVFTIHHDSYATRKRKKKKLVMEIHLWANEVTPTFNKVANHL